jgi:hypothetical protein
MERRVLAKMSAKHSAGGATRPIRIFSESSMCSSTGKAASAHSSSIASAASKKASAPDDA